MPFKSKAQRRKFAELLVEGKIKPDTYEEWNRETGRARLPERVSQRRTSSKRRSAAQATKRKVTKTGKARVKRRRKAVKR